MRYSQMLIPTMKEDPSDAQVVSHRLMIRAGMIRKVAAGIYNYLPLGWRVIQKVSQIVKEEMNRSGAQEISMPMVQPAEIWQKSGRWFEYGPELLRLKDRKEADFCLGPTHEEVVTELVSDLVKSYKQMPLSLYQIQTKFRDEIRPRFGLMRSREFMMKDAYSFDADQKSAMSSYQKMYDAYCRIFERCGLQFRAVEADTGSIGGNLSHEFQVLAETGEDLIASCDECGYAANVELVVIAPPEEIDTAQKKYDDCVDVLTPNRKTCAEVADFLGISITKTAKTVLFMVDDKPVMALCRGDHEVNEAKLKRALKTKSARLMTDEEALKLVGPVGFLGPVGVSNQIRVIADLSLKTLSSLIVGANQIDHHKVNAVLNRDFSADFFDIRTGVSTDKCGKCLNGKLTFYRGIEVGHVFYLGKKYSEPMQATFLDKAGDQKLMEMGCYGIGIGRTVAAAIEQNHDDKGIVWPIAITPFQVSLVRLGQEESVIDTADKIYEALLNKKIEVLYDDRDERAGIKFAEHDLIGSPLRVTVGGKSLKEGLVEIKERMSTESYRVSLNELLEYIEKKISNMIKGAHAN